MLISLLTITPARKQKGMSLLEMMVAMLVSLIASLAMVTLMANTLGTGTRTIQMAHLTEDLRAALQIMTRDLRRASYTSEGIQCFGNPWCGSNGTLNLPGGITASDNCLIFQMDRGHDGDGTNDQAGAFRRRVVGAGDNARGLLEAWVGTGVPGSCALGTAWSALTDPRTVNITQFRVETANEITTNMPLSYTEVIMDNASGQTRQTVRKVQIRLSGELVTPNTNYPILRTVEDIIRVRNNLVIAPS